MFKSQKGELSQVGEVDTIKKSHNFINQIADLKKQNADMDTIKNRASKLSHMDVEKWRKLKSPNGKDSPKKGDAGKSP